MGALDAAARAGLCGPSRGLPCGSAGGGILGVRLHDLPAGGVEERLHMAGELGFSCVQLASKVVYASYGIDRSGLTHELASRIREAADDTGVKIAVFGCYRNLAVPDADRLDNELAEYEACCRFAAWLGTSVVGTETGRPNLENAVADDRFSDEALFRFCDGLRQACAYAEVCGLTLAIEPGWNETACTPERCRHVLDVVTSPALGVIYDPVSLLHPSIADKAQEEVDRMLGLCGNRIVAVHAKDYEIVDNEDSLGWCDGTGRRLVYHGAGETGAFDFAPLMRWLRQMRPETPVIIENFTL